MRVFIVSCLTAAVLATVAAVVLNSVVQEPVEVAYTGDGARI